MNERNFIQYIGDHRFHDAYIEDIIVNQDTVMVIIKGSNKELIKIVFRNVIEIKESKAKKMMLYSISEMSNEEPYRNFVFVNWDEDGDAYLEITSQYFEFS